MCASLSVYLTSAVPMSGARWGFPSSPMLLFLYATACGLRRTFTPSPNRASRIAFGHVKTLGVRITLISKLYQHFRVRVTPTASRMLCLRFACFVRRLPATPPQTQDSIRVGG